jgi:beta-lactamase regulating signal transducer with metallopeptidase domain
MNALMYLLQVNLYLLLFYLLYLVLLRKETFFKMNRFYLVGSALLSLAIPLMKLQWVKDLFLGEQVFQVTERIGNVIANEHAINKTVNNVQETSKLAPTLSNLEIVAIIYGVITLLFLLNFLRKLYLLKKALYAVKTSQAFSFFNQIVVDDTLEGKDIIVNHEMVHVQQWHSLDVIFFEIFTAFNWFNPVAFLYRKAIKDIHEFIADETAASTLEDKSAYTLLLVSNVFGAKPQQLTNSFFNQSLLKRRIIMLHKTKSRQVAILKYGLSVPLFVSMVILSSATATAEKLTKAIESSPIIEVLSNSAIRPIEEVRSPVLDGDVSARKKPKSTTEQLKGHNVETDSIVKSPGKNGFENLIDYVGQFWKKQSPFNSEFGVGVSYYSFDVDDNKKASNFKVIKSVSPDKEARMLIHLSAFKDSINLAKGTYNFYEGDYFGFAGDDSADHLDKDIHVIFGTIGNVFSEFITRDETKLKAGRIVNYLKAPYLKSPVILVDGKEISYKVNDKVFELGETIDTKQQEVKILKGDAAVAAYNESARNGLIIITTKQKI